jgi:hypothetical protein
MRAADRAYQCVLKAGDFDECLPDLEMSFPQERLRRKPLDGSPSYVDVIVPSPSSILR